MWEKADGENLDGLLLEDVAENAVRRIQTICMVVDCQTRRMKPVVMTKTMETGQLS